MHEWVSEREQEREREIVRERRERLYVCVKGWWGHQQNQRDLCNANWAVCFCIVSCITLWASHTHTHVSITEEFSANTSHLLSLPLGFSSPVLPAVSEAPSPWHEDGPVSTAHAWDIVSYLQANELRNQCGWVARCLVLLTFSYQSAA